MSVPEAEDSHDLDRRGVSNALGFILLIALVVGGTASVAILGASALSDTQQHSELERAELSMTLFDSRAAMVALGSSDSQRVRFGQESGHFETNPDESRMIITQKNYSGNGDDEEIFNDTLGSLVYENDGTEIAYEGGGVWRSDPEGKGQMLSPPEFHFREATLTLPIIRVSGEDSAGNLRLATVSTEHDARDVFPDADTSYTIGDRSYLNPVRNGTVTVKVQSDYYTAWADYFRERTAGEVKVYDNNRTVDVTLVSIEGSLGAFDMPPENEGIDIEGIGNEHPVTNFKVNLSFSKNPGENHWAMYSKSGAYEEFELHIEPDFKDCEARVSIYYSNSNLGEHREWESPWFTDSSDALTACSSEEYLELDLSNDDVDMAYQDITDATGSGTKFCFGETISDTDLTSDATIDQHGTGDDGPDPGPVSPNDGTSDWELEPTLNHYLGRLGPSYELTVKDAQGNFCEGGGNGNGNSGSDTVDESASSGVFEFDETAGAQYITFLHVTENQIEVSLD